MPADILASADPSAAQIPEQLRSPMPIKGPLLNYQRAYAGLRRTTLTCCHLPEPVLAALTPWVQRRSLGAA